MLLGVVLAASTLGATASAPLVGVPRALPETFYVSVSGSDSNAGTSPSAAWRSVARVNSAALQPGDTVLFEGGQSFTDSTLMPGGSGSSGDPVRFASYGSGRASLTNGIWVPAGRHDLVFDDLDISSNGILVASAASGSGVQDITLENSALHDTPQAGVNIQPQDSHWTVSGNSFRHIGDSAIINWAPGTVISGNSFTDIGWNPQITYAKHGIYAKGADMVIDDNDFSDIPNGQAVSIRYHGARVYGNTIHDTPYAFAFFDFDTSPAPQGVSEIYDNKTWNVNGYAFYYGSGTDPNGKPPSVSFVLANNTFQLAGGEAVNLADTPSSASITLANNIFAGSYGSAYRGCPTCSEHNNDWSGATSDIPTGNGDLTANPDLNPAPNLNPQTGSPVIDAGTTTIPDLTYTPTCNGTPTSYCGTNPDIGSDEYTFRRAGPVDPARR